MSEALEELFLFGEEKMEKAITQLHREFGSIRSGRANPMILDKVLVEYYGAPTPLRQMSQVSVQDGTTLVITPYDKSILKEIEKAIIKAEIGITPNSDGICIRLPFPPLTEERRRETAKDVKKIGILGIQNGQIIKNIDYELEKIIKNINDINTDDKPRELNVKIKIIPINNKKQLVIECTPTAKLRPLNTVQSTLFNIQETDKETGVVFNKLQEITDVAIGQMNIDGEIQEAPEPIYIGVDI